MAKTKIKNFQLLLGDIAVTKTSRNKVPFVEVAFIHNDNIRGLFTFPRLKYYSGNIPEDRLAYVQEEVDKNLEFLKD